MKHKRRWLSEILFQTRLLHATKAALRDRVVVLNYHRIRPDEANFQTSFDDGVYGPTVSEFDAQVGWLKQNVKLISEAELIDALQTRRGPGEMCVLITTDDGYRDNYTRAFPILRKHGAPAIFFVASALIESRRLGWWDQLAYLLKHATATQFTHRGKSVDLESDGKSAFDFFAREIIERMPGEPEVLLAELSRACDVPLPTDSAQDAELMTWQQLREVRQHAVAIGSHTHSHRVLSRLSREQQREELTHSRALIEERIGGPIRSIAYPTGGRAHFTAETQQVARDVGYEAGFSFYSGYNRWPTMHAFDIKRVAVEYHDSIGVAGAAVLPELLTSPF